ncbi:hypothetical protein BT96DRAFT_980298, partial [Gymnopus androsaceus JB14]
MDTKLSVVELHQGSFHVSTSPSGNPSSGVVRKQKKVLGNVALVCKFFNFLAVPMLFRKVRTFPEREEVLNNNLNHVYQLEQDRPVPIGLIRLLAYPEILWLFQSGELFGWSDPPHQCSYIEECVIEDCVDQCDSNSVSYHDIYASALPKMSNLTSLNLTDSKLSLKLLRSISQLQKLHSLTLVDCTINSEILVTDIVAFTSRIQLQSLSVFFQPAAEPKQSQMADIVLLAANSHLKELTTNSQGFLHCLAHAKSLSRIFQPYTNSFSVCRSLVGLTMGGVRWPEEAKGLPGTLPLGAYLLKNVDFSLSLTSFPNLRRLFCPSYLAYLFTGPHSLELISLSQKMDKDVQDLRKEEDLELSADT